MPAVTQEKIKRPPGAFNGGPHDNWNDGGRGDAGEPLIPSAQLGLWIFMIAVTMLFAGLASAYMISRSGPTWESIPTPRILWFNTAVLLLSSGLLERARRALKQADRSGLTRGLWLTALLGSVFLIGQLEAWRQLRLAGVYLPSNPHSSFFYLLTGMHGLHFLGGVGLLGYVLFLAGHAAPARRLHSRFNLCAVYWHFLDGLWLYLFWLFIGK